jgi:uncharacterized protein
MRNLLDINVLIALLDPDHKHHDAATEWFASSIRQGWASCPITQNGCIRIMSHPKYPGSFHISEIAGRLTDAVAHPSHRFWPDDVSILNLEAIDIERLPGSKHLTDIYLIALAVHHGGRLATFDRRIPAEALTETPADHLLILF